MLKRQLKGCMLLVFMFIVVSFLICGMRLGIYLYPQYEAIIVVIVIAISAAIFATIISYNIYNFVMKRYKVLAPDEPYEYKKMAEITYTKNDAKFIRALPRID